MKKYLLISLLTCLLFIPTLHAKTPAIADKARYDPMFVPIDILLFRPLSLATTIADSALFIAVSQFTALSSIAPQHDYFQRVGDIFVDLQTNYTVMRHSGDKRFKHNYH